MLLVDSRLTTCWRSSGGIAESPSKTAAGLFCDGCASGNGPRGGVRDVVGVSSLRLVDAAACGK
ncbi:hypothetical protein, partial [Xanthomonas euvesicatoria]